MPQIAQAGKAQLVVPLRVLQQRQHLLRMAAGGIAEVIQKGQLQLRAKLVKHGPKRLLQRLPVALIVQQPVGDQPAVVKPALAVDDLQRLHHQRRVSRRIDGLHGAFPAINARLAQKLQQQPFQRPVPPALQQAVFSDDIGKKGRLHIVPAAAVVLRQRHGNAVHGPQKRPDLLRLPGLQPLQRRVQSQHAFHPPQAALHTPEKALLHKARSLQQRQLTEDPALHAVCPPRDPPLPVLGPGGGSKIKADQAGAYGKIQIDQSLHRHDPSSPRCAQRVPVQSRCSA